MGLRATVIKKYEVSYGDTQGFNYDSEVLADLLNHFCDSAYCGGEYRSTAAIWEVPREEFQGMVDRISSMTDTEFAEACEEATGTDNYTREQVLDVFRGWLAETPADSPYVRFGWL